MRGKSMYPSGLWKCLAAVVMLIASAAGARASAVIALVPPDGVVSGAPGSTVGWGFSLINGADWVSIDSVTTENETSPLGTQAGVSHPTWTCWADCQTELPLRT